MPLGLSYSTLMWKPHPALRFYPTVTDAAVTDAYKYCMGAWRLSCRGICFAVMPLGQRAETVPVYGLKMLLYLQPRGALLI